MRRGGGTSSGGGSSDSGSSSVGHPADAAARQKERGFKSFKLVPER
jgi:hypothetical protein